MNEIDIIKARKLIAEKEWITVNAARDIQLGGWKMDYSVWMESVDTELQEIINRNNIKKERLKSGDRIKYNDSADIYYFVGFLRDGRIVIEDSRGCIRKELSDNLRID